MGNIKPYFQCTNFKIRNSFEDMESAVANISSDMVSLSFPDFLSGSRSSEMG